jgi:hypothetical protein
LQKAYNLYNRAWEVSAHKNTYVGINAATLSLLLGMPEISRETAVKILSTESPVVGPRFSSYWYRATQAEANLLLGRLGRARRLYQGAMALLQRRRPISKAAETR